MFVGHAALAFALVALSTRRLGWDARPALVAGVVAGAFATIPDVDMAYALVGLAGADGGALAFAASFWAASSAVHRAVTHSLVFAPVVAGAVAAWVRGGRCRPVAIVLVALLVGASTTKSGVLGGALVLLLGVVALGTAAGVRRYTRLSGRQAFAVSLVGLASHPFGDLFTGHPPAFLYPFDVVLFESRIALSADPTLHLLGAFAVELAAIWAGVVVALRLTETRATVTPRATLGAGYAAVVPFIPPPTLEFSYPFVFSVLAVGALGFVPRVQFDENRTGGLRLRVAWARRTPTSLAFERPDAPTALLTALVAVTVAWAAYALAYATTRGLGL